MFINQPTIICNLTAGIFLSFTSLVNAATIYACKDKAGTILYSNNACSPNTVEVYHRLVSPSLTTTQSISTSVNINLQTDSVFSPTSFWYQDISKARIDGNSANWTAEFLRQKAAYFGTVGINTYSYSAPVFTVDDTVKSVKVEFNNCQNKSSVDAGFLAQMSAVPIPKYAIPATGGDDEMAIYKPSTGEYWEMWHTKHDAVTGVWSACWGGKIDNTKLSDGVFPSYYGTTATSLPFIGGQITAEELSRGEIRHAIGISLVDLSNWDVVSWPAHRSDGSNPLKLMNRIAEGQRFRLDPTVNVDALPLGKAGKTIARAAQKYGFVVWDKAGAITLRAQNANGYTAQGLADPYPAVYEYMPLWKILQGFPFERLQFLPRNYGKP